MSLLVVQRKTRTTQGKDQPQTCHRPVHRPPTLLPERGGFTSRHVTAPAFKGKSGRNVSGCSEVCGLGWRHTAGDGAAAREWSGGHRTKARGPACHAVPLCTLPILSHMQVLLNKHTFKKKNTPVSCTPQIKLPCISTLENCFSKSVLNVLQLDSIHLYSANHVN